MNGLNSEKDRRLIKPREDRQRNICFQAEDKRNHVTFLFLKTDRRALKPFAEFPLLRAGFPHHCSDPLRAPQPWCVNQSASSWESPKRGAIRKSQRPVPMLDGLHHLTFFPHPFALFVSDGLSKGSQLLAMGRRINEWVKKHRASSD